MPPLIMILHDEDAQILGVLCQLRPPYHTLTLSSISVTATAIATITVLPLISSTTTRTFMLAAEVELAHLAPARVVYERAVTARAPRRQDRADDVVFFFCGFASGHRFLCCDFVVFWRGKGIVARWWGAGEHHHG